MRFGRTLGKATATGTTLGILLVAAPSLAGSQNLRPVVVELYTSQGCDSCPPADAILEKLSRRPDILALSLPVTYWDMLGWKDTLASEANTRRQKAYSAAMGHSAVYTPQMIIDGVSDVVGSREADVEAAIAARRAEIEAAATQAVSDAHAEDLPSVPVTAVETPKEMHIAIGAVSDKVHKHNATIWMFHLRSAVTVNIGAGENQGRTTTYRNVVADLRAVGMWKGQPMSLDLPRSEMAGLPHDGVAIVVQQGGYGRVVGAASINHPAYYPP